VRDGFRPAPVRVEETAVGIVGAGAAGLSAAWALERAGLKDFVVLELEDAAGGTARSGRSDVTPYPWGAHYVPAPSPENRPLLALLDEVGAVASWNARREPVWAEEVLCRDPQERIFLYGSWYEGLFPRAGASREDVLALEALETDMRGWAARRDAQGRRAFDLPRARGSADPAFKALDRRSFADYAAEKGWTSPRMRWYLEYACRDDFGATLAQTSAWAGIHYYAARIREKGQEPGEFLTWPEGNGRLVSHLASVAGSRLRVGALVTSIDPETGTITYLDAERNEAFALKAEHVVCATPRFLAPYLLGRAVPGAEEAVYGTWMVANLHLRDRPGSSGFPLAWDNVLYESPSLGYVTATHQRGRDFGPTVLTYYLPLIDDDVRRARRLALGRSWEEWVRLIVSDLSRPHKDLPGLLERVDVYLWGHAMVRPRTGFLWSDALRDASRPMGRVHFAHTDLSGLALFEEAQYWGIRAAEAILEARKAAFRSWLEAPPV
jgi:phytoene dehydrogenase-like protein